MRNASIIVLLAAMLSARGALAESSDVESLTGLSLEDLGRVEITSVSRSAQALSEAPAAAYVVTRDDVLSAGVTSIPEMLRLAPNLEVAQASANSYAISARGFNGVAADQLLVLMDGRNVYTPYFSGVFWDVQDMLPENVERIEVVSGPGATLWGANAVAGVINIISRESKDTQGASFEIGGGNQLVRASAQYGGRLSNELTYRFYAEDFSYAHDETPAGLDARDGWRKLQGGFRADWHGNSDLVTLQGDLYHGAETHKIPEALNLGGGNLLGRWSRSFADGSSLQLQSYMDVNNHYDPGLAGNYTKTYDIDFQHAFSFWRQDVVWGGSYRVVQDRFPVPPVGNPIQFFNPVARRLTLSDLFVQDGVALSDDLKLTAGVKLEDDPYVGLDALPSARLAWKIDDPDLLWAAISRAIRTPSRLDRDFNERIGRTSFVSGGDFQSEKLIAYEAGYRTTRWARTTLSVSAYYNDYRDLRTVEFTPVKQFPIYFGNGMTGYNYGVDFWAAVALTERWEMTAGGSLLQEKLTLKPGAMRISGVTANDPHQQFSIGSKLRLSDDWAADIRLREVGSLPNPRTSSYTEADAALHWLISPALELSLSGANLLHARHVEFVQAAGTVEIPRTVFANARWRL